MHEKESNGQGKRPVVGTTGRMAGTGGRPVDRHRESFRAAQEPDLRRPAENREVISFARALAVVSGQNPQIAFANEQINEAFAQLKGAKVLWLPSLQAGVNYQNHDGPLQNSDGTITAASRSAWETGLGMYAVGGGAPAIPGVSAKFAVADAVFQPRIAEQAVAARQQAATAASHDVLLAAAVVYLDLLRAFGQQAVAEETLAHAEQLAALTAAFARSGQGSQADADRANGGCRAEKRPGPGSRADPDRLGPIGGAAARRPEPRLRAGGTGLDADRAGRAAAPTADLIADGLSRRPELEESRHAVAEAARRLDRDATPPCCPTCCWTSARAGSAAGRTPP